MSQLLEEVNKAVSALREGKVILYPTDTIWGIGCDASNQNAVDKISGIKKRVDNKSLIVLLSDINELQRYVQKVPDIAWDLVEFAESPLTVIYPQGKSVSPSVLGPDGSIAIRVVKDKFCKELTRRFGKAITATSANITGEKEAVSFNEINEVIKESVDYTVSYRQQEVIKSKPSTIVKLEVDGTIKFLRR